MQTKPITDDDLRAARDALAGAYDADERLVKPRGGTSARLAWEVLDGGWPGTEGLDLNDEGAIVEWLAEKIHAGHVRNELRRMT